MSRQIQIRRGTADENDAFTGAIGEVTMDTTNKTLRVHDGETAGGTALAKQSEIPEPYVMPNNYDFVIEFQEPDSENNYTWYRKYKSGWVEQGQKVGSLPNNTSTTITLPVALQSRNLSFTQISCGQAGFGANDTLSARVSTDGTKISIYQQNSANANMDVCWEAKGMSAS